MLFQMQAFNNLNLVIFCFIFTMGAYLFLSLSVQMTSLSLVMMLLPFKALNLFFICGFGSKILAYLNISLGLRWPNPNKVFISINANMCLIFFMILIKQVLALLITQWSKISSSMTMIVSFLMIHLYTINLLVDSFTLPLLGLILCFLSTFQVSLYINHASLTLMLYITFCTI